MKWIIKLEDRPLERILVKFHPLLNVVEFIGQYKVNNIWTDFSLVSVDDNLDNMDLTVIQDKISLVYDDMKNKIDIFTNLNNGFSLLKIIEIDDGL